MGTHGRKQYTADFKREVVGLIVGILVTAQGGLQILVPPLIDGHLGNLRQILAQTNIHKFLGELGC